MNKIEHLKTIIDYENSEKRVEESKYFTEEILDFFEIKKYRELFKEYQQITFVEETFCKLGEKKDKEKDSFIWFLTLDNKSVEEGLNVLMDIDEMRSSDIKEEEKGKDYDPYFLTNNSIPISVNENVSYIFLSKTNKKVLKFYAYDDTWDWQVLANNFDEFIDRLYVIEPEKEELTEEKKKKIVLQKYIKKSMGVK